MRNRIGIRLEDKNDWERRVALTPAAVGDLVSRGVEFQVERFARRTYPDSEFEAAGAHLTDDVRECEIVLGIKEMPVEYFRAAGAYMFFSHTIKGQPYNMDMLASLVRNRCTLLDYEVVTDEDNRRLIFFGKYAGLAGMIDTIWTTGQRLLALGCETPLAAMKPAHAYETLDDCKEAISGIGRRISAEGLPRDLAPMVFGITGYGNVSQGAQEILDLLPCVEVAPDDLASFVDSNGSLCDRVAKVVYHEEHLVERIDGSSNFELQEYYDRPELYRSAFEPHLELLSVLVNGIYWNDKYPRLADVEQLRTLFNSPSPPRLIAVGDITCDVDGSLACTMRDTEPGDPVYIYDPATRETPSGFEGKGLAVMAVGNLPCELPREASNTFSEALAPFIPALAGVDLEAPFDEAELPEPVRRSVILWRGEFTPNFRYMKDFPGLS